MVRMQTCGFIRGHTCETLEVVPGGGLSPYRTRSPALVPTGAVSPVSGLPMFRSMDPSNDVDTRAWGPSAAYRAPQGPPFGIWWALAPRGRSSQVYSSGLESICSFPVAECCLPRTRPVRACTRNASRNGVCAQGQDRRMLVPCGPLTEHWSECGAEDSVVCPEGALGTLLGTDQGWPIWAHRASEPRGGEGFPARGRCMLAG